MSEEEKVEQAVRVTNPELKAMHHISKILEGLDDGQKRRVFAWLEDMRKEQTKVDSIAELRNLLKPKNLDSLFLSGPFSSPYGTSVKVAPSDFYGYHPCEKTADYTTSSPVSSPETPPPSSKSEESPESSVIANGKPKAETTP